MRPYFKAGPAREPTGLLSLKLPEPKPAEALDTDVVFDLPSVRWHGRIASLVPAAGKNVFGRLYWVPEGYWAAVRAIESDEGETQELVVRVRSAGETYDATAFVAVRSRRSFEGPVSERFVDALASDAEPRHFPVEYLTRLKAEALIVSTLQTAGSGHLRPRSGKKG
jgi:hypothetical protein